MDKKISNGTGKHLGRPHHLANGFANGLTEPQDERTDLTRWRLRDDRGRQTWHYLETDQGIEQWPQSLADKHFLGLQLVREPFP